MHDATVTRIATLRAVHDRAVVPEREHVLCPAMLVNKVGTQHVCKELPQQLTARICIHVLNAQGIYGVEKQGLPPRFRVRADDRVLLGLPSVLIWRDLHAGAFATGSIALMAVWPPCTVNGSLALYHPA